MKTEEPKKYRKVFVKTYNFDPLHNAISQLNYVLSIIYLIEKIDIDEEGEYVDENGCVDYQAKIDEIIQQLNFLKKEIQSTLFFIGVIQHNKQVKNND